jgi:hypothetical protein
MSKRLVGLQKNDIETLESFSMEIDLEIDHATLTLRYISGITVFHGLWRPQKGDADPSLLGSRAENECFNAGTVHLFAT